LKCYQNSEEEIESSNTTTTDFSDNSLVFSNKVSCFHDISFNFTNFLIILSYIFGWFEQLL